jgi:hypothetical protein
MSFISGMKKKAGEMVSQMMDEDGGPDGELLRRDVERIEASLQAQIKELKGFVNGMNSMLGAALSAAQLYREAGGDGKLATTVREAASSPPRSLRYSPSRATLAMLLNRFGLTHHFAAADV